MLDDLLNTPQAPTATDRRATVAFTQEWQPGGESTITATSSTKLEDTQLHDFITERGGLIPDGHTAVMISARYNPNAWHREEPYDQDGRKTPAVTRGSWSYTFKIIPTATPQQSAIEDLLQLVKGKAPKRAEQKTNELFVYALGDSQLGKPDGDGTEGIIRAWTQSLTTARKEWIKAGKPAVLVCGLGDHLEGNQSQGGRNFYRSDLTISEQLRLFRRMLLRTIDTFIEAPSIMVGVVNGNHDDIQRFQTTDASDGHATESAIAVSEAISLNHERYGHTKIFVPGKDEDHLVIEANGTNFVLIHGHQFPRGKAMEWWEKQTFNNHPAGHGHILIHGHEHEFQISSRRDRLVITTPALESESTWFKQKQGAVGRRGALIFITKPAGQFEGMSIV